MTEYVVTGACVFIPARPGFPDAHVLYEGSRLPAHTEPDRIRHLLDARLVEEVPAPDLD